MKFIHKAAAFFTSAIIVLSAGAFTAAAADNSASVAEINSTNFPDDTFRNYVSENFDTDNSGGLSQAEIDAVTEINVAGNYSAPGNIASLAGIEYFTNLTSLNCGYNQLISLDVSRNTELKYLNGCGNQLTSLDISGNTALENLVIEHNPDLGSIDLSRNTALLYIDVLGCGLSSLDVSNNTLLKDLTCHGNSLTSLDTSKNTELVEICCWGNKLTSLDLRNNTKLQRILCDHNSIAELDLTNNTELTYIRADEDTVLIGLNLKKTTMSISGFNSYYSYVRNGGETLSDGSTVFEGNDIYISVDVNDYINHELYINDEKILIDKNISEMGYRFSYSVKAEGTEMSIELRDEPWSAEHLSGYCMAEVDDNAKVYYCSSYSGNIDYRQINTGEYVRKGSSVCVLIKKADMPQNGIITINGIYIPYEQNSSGQYQSMVYIVPEDSDELKVAICDEGSVDTSDVVAVNEKTFPNGNFRNYVSKNFDKDNSGGLAQWEINQVTKIDVRSSNISSLKGIEYFTNLKTLDCGNNKITSLDVSSNTALTTLYCYLNQLTRLDVSKNTALKDLQCNANKLTRLDVSNNTALERLVVECNSSLGSINVSRNTALLELDVFACGLTSLDISNNVNLQELSCYSNSLTSLDTSNNVNLQKLVCDSNSLTLLDLRNNTKLQWLRCHNNSIAELDLTNNKELTYIRADEDTVIIGYDRVKTTLSISGFNGETSYVSGNSSILTDGSSIYEDNDIYLHVNINDYIDHELYINNEKVLLDDYLNGDGYIFYKSYLAKGTEMSIELREEAWTAERLSGYNAVEVDDRVQLYYYNYYGGMTRRIYTGDYVKKGTQVGVIVDKDDIPQNNVITVNGAVVDCVLNSNGKYQVIIDVPDDAQKLNISIKEKEIEISIGEKLYAYYEDTNGNVGDLPNGSTILPEYSAIYVHADIDDYVDHALYVNGRELALTQTGDGYHFYGTIEDPLSYDKLEVKLVEKAWTDTELAKYVRVYADKGINVYHYNSYYGEAKINYTVPGGGYFTKDEAIVIRVDAEKYPNAGTLYINGQPIQCSLNDDNQWQIWAYDIPDDAEKLNISFKGKSISLCEKIYAYYEDNTGNVDDLPSGSIIYPEYSAIYVHADIDDYVDHALYVNDQELALTQTGDGYHFFGTIENPFSYDKLEVKLVEKAWTDTELAKYVRVYADDGIDVYHYNPYYGEAKINYTVPGGGYFTKDEAIVIRVDAEKYPNAGTLYINGQPIQCSLNDDNQWQLWAYEIPDDVQKLTISFRGREISLGDKIYAYYQDNRGNITALPNGSTILPEHSVIYLHVDIDDYVDHMLYVNDQELSLIQTGDGYHFFGTIENPFSYDKLEVKLVEKAWTDTELANYLRVYADEGIDVYHYNSYYGVAQINYTVPSGGFFTKNEAIVIRADAAQYPNAGTLYINGKPVQCTLNADNQWQIWAYEIPDESDVLKISFSGSEEICDVITGVTVTEKYIIVTYSNADKTASDTKTLAFDEVDVSIVDYMNKTDIRIVIDFVNAFSNSEVNTIILTEAQLRAIEYVLAYDYAK